MTPKFWIDVYSLLKCGQLLSGMKSIDIYKFWFCFDNAESSRIHLLRHCLLTPAGFWFNIKMSSYQYRESNCGDKTILGPSYLHNGISYTGKMTSLYWFSPLTLISYYNSFMIWRKMYHCLLTYLKQYFLNFVKIFYVFTYNINTVKKCSQYFYRVNGLVDPIMARIHTLIKQSRVSLSVKVIHKEYSRFLNQFFPTPCLYHKLKMIIHTSYINI